MDFTPSPRVESLKKRIVEFLSTHVYPVEMELLSEDHLVKTGVPYPPRLVEIRKKAKGEGLWNLFLPGEHGAGLTNWEYGILCEEMGRSLIAPAVFNCSAPDTGNIEILEEFGTPEQQRRWLRPLLDGEIRSCFSMTEPEVAGSDPTLIRTRAVKDGDHWVINGHKWFISGARGATFAIVIAKTDPDADPPQARNTAFIVELDTPGFNIVRDVETMAGHGNHCEIRFENVRVPDASILGGRGQGHRLGQVRLGPARLAHCMRWIGNAEIALEMLVKRAQERPLHGGVLADKQLVQAMMAESAMELYAAKLMVLHAAYLIEKGKPFRQEVSMAKHHVANMLWRITDRAIQVHGALGYSTDTPLERMLRHARSARLVDGADEVHLSQIASNVMSAMRDEGSSRRATGFELL